MIPNARTMHEGPHHNGGVLATMSTVRLAEEDAARRAYLDEAAKYPDRSRQACPECASGGRHKPGCSQRRSSRAEVPRPEVEAVPPASRCSGPQCVRRAGALGLCSQHRQQRRRGQALAPIRPYVRRGPR